MLPVQVASSLVRYGGNVLLSEATKRFGQDQRCDAIFDDSVTSMQAQIETFAEASEAMLDNAHPYSDKRQELRDDVLELRTLCDFIRYYGPKSKEESDALPLHASPSKPVVDGLLTIMHQKESRLLARYPDPETDTSQ